MDAPANGVPDDYTEAYEIVSTHELVHTSRRIVRIEIVRNLAKLTPAFAAHYSVRRKVPLARAGSAQAEWAWLDLPAPWVDAPTASDALESATAFCAKYLNDHPSDD